MAAREVEGLAGKQADGRDPKTGELRKDKTNGAVSVRIDSARAAGGGTSEFGARLRQLGLWNGLFEAKELVVLSDGVPWVRTSHEKAPDGK